MQVKDADHVGDSMLARTFSVIKWRGARVFFMGLLIGGVIVPFMGEAALERRVVEEDEGRLLVTVAWAFTFAPESGLILEETIPDGWLAGAVESPDASVRVRDEGALRTIAVVGDPWIVPSGSLSYTLTPLAGSVDTTADFSGSGLTMNSARIVKLSTGGVRHYLISPPEEDATGKVSALRMASFDIESGGFPVGGRIRFEVTGHTEGSNPVIQGQTEGLVIYVDYRPSLTGPGGWQCIHTSMPPHRVEQDEIWIPNDALHPGFYRLRTE